MTNGSSPEEITARLVDFIRDRFLGGDPDGGFDESTPLLELGVLNSLNTAILLNFIHNDLGQSLSLEQITARTFQDVRSISATLTASEPHVTDPR